MTFYEGKPIVRIANLNQRAAVVSDGRAFDIATASDGRFGPDTLSVLEQWDSVVEWAASADLGTGQEFAEEDLGPVVDRPRQIFAIGLNYRDHADEAGLDHPDNIVVFTKFASSLTGPVSTLGLTSETVDWEAELVAVIGRETHRVDEATALDAVAGYTVGQDFSDRGVQLRPPAAQFSLGKSFPGFAPVGPTIVTLDELSDSASLRITCTITGPSGVEHGEKGSWTVQDGNSADLIFPVARVISDLSQVVTLYPGDLIFTGTPAGVGSGRKIFLQPGDTVQTSIDGLGTIVSTCTAPE